MINFPGSNDWYDPTDFVIDKLDTNITSFSISFWFKSNLKGGRVFNQGTSSSAGNVQLFLGVGGGEVFFRHTNLSAASKHVFGSTDCSDDVLRHCLLVYSSASNVGKVYLNGTDDTAGSAYTSDPGVSTGPRVGALQDGSRDFRGDLGELAVWEDVLLTQGDAARLAAGVPASILVGSKPRVYKPMVNHVDASGIANHHYLANPLNMAGSENGTPAAAGYHPPVLFAG